MTKGILVVTWSGGEEPCTLLLKSLWNVSYPVFIVVNDAHNMDKGAWKRLYRLSGEQNWTLHANDKDSFEIGAIDIVLNNTNWSELVILQDTFEIKDQKVFDLLFDSPKSVMYNPYFQMYLGKFKREVLEKMRPFPEIKTKRDSVKQEWDFTKRYRDIDRDMTVFNPAFDDSNFLNNFHEMFGRNNMVLEDQYLIKRKGTWNATQLGEE